MLRASISRKRVQRERDRDTVYTRAGGLTDPEGSLSLNVFALQDKRLIRSRKAQIMFRARLTNTSTVTTSIATAVGDGEQCLASGSVRWSSSGVEGSSSLNSADHNH